MKITVVLCTYNRCKSLAKALDSLATQNVSESVGWEVLVVDNNSSDQTREVVEDFCRRHPSRIRYVFEPRQGLSHARNTGIREARGNVLSFMDDDVTVDPTWLHNLTAGLCAGDWSGAGGRILSEKTFSAPPWLALEGPYIMVGIVYAHFDLGETPHQLDSPPHGTNMAFQKTMFEKYGGFRTDLGRCGSNMISNEDTEFGGRLLAAGERLWYEPSAVVHHPVPEDRIRKQYFLTWWFDYGRSKIREVGKRPAILGIPRSYFSIPKLMGITLLKALRWNLTVNPQQRFFCKVFVWYFAGQIAEIYHQSRRKDNGVTAQGNEDHRNSVHV